MSGVLFRNWGATDDEIHGSVIGDELCPEARAVATRSITLTAPPDQVFPWIRQMGFGRAGWYSYDWIDNLGKKSASVIHPEWQEVVSGSSIPGGPVNFEVAIVEPPRAFVMTFIGRGRLARQLQFTLAYELRDHQLGTRLVTRMRARLEVPGGRWLEHFLLIPGDGLMVRKQLLTLARRVAPRTPSNQG